MTDKLLTDTKFLLAICFFITMVSCNVERSDSQSTINAVEKLKIKQFQDKTFHDRGDVIFVGNYSENGNGGYLAVQYDRSTCKIGSIDKERYKSPIAYEEKEIKEMCKTFCALNVVCIEVDSCQNVYVRLDDIMKTDLVQIKEQTCINKKLRLKPYKKGWYKVIN